MVAECIREQVSEEDGPHLVQRTRNQRRNKIVTVVGHQEHLLSTVERCKLVVFGHVTRSNTLSFKKLWMLVLTECNCLAACHVHL